MELLKSLLEYLPKLVGALNNIAEKLQAGNHLEGIENLGKVSPGIEWVIEGYYKLNLGDESAESLRSSLNSALNSVNLALENRDYATVADCVEYTIKPLFEEILSQLMKTNISS